MPEKTYTLDEVREKLSSSPAWAERALLALLARQTEDERIEKSARYENGRGFNGTDAGLLSSFAEQVAKKRAAGVPLGNALSAKQREIAFRKLPKYARQVLEEIETRQAGDGTPETPAPAPAGAIAEAFFRAPVAVVDDRPIDPVYDLPLAEERTVGEGDFGARVVYVAAGSLFRLLLRSFQTPEERDTFVEKAQASGEFLEVEAIDFVLPVQA